MDAVSEQDLELLEEYLDGALPGDDAGRLRGRLAREPDLAATVAELESDRAARAAVWASIEPGEAEARSFARRVSAAARRREAWGHVRRYTRFGSAAAACMLVGYFVGWAGQDGGPGMSGRGGGTGINQISGGGTSGGAVRYRVPVGYDESGRPITQDFDSFDDAQRFADEVRRLQDLRQGHPVIIQEQL